MKIAIITLFPEMFTAITNHGVLGRAYQQGAIKIAYFNPRDYSQDKHKRVDDSPYGGGPGMVMAIQPLEDALFAAKQYCPSAKVILLSPAGQPFKQEKALLLSNSEALILVNGRYEGIDQRFIDTYVDEAISIGDYVLTGGELASMVLIDAITRLIPGVLGNNESATIESFNKNLLDHPHYTKPAVYKGKAVPDVLLSGNHAKISAWREKQQLSQTKTLRPDLLDNKN